MNGLNNIFGKANMRVEWSQGQNSILLIAPHGHKLDDTHTDVVTRTMAKHLKSSYVINYGWRRGKNFDASKEIANCNDIRHVQRPEVCDFNDPVCDLVANIKATYGVCQILFVHGMSQTIRGTYPTIDIVVGYGEGTPPRYTCDLWRKDLLIDMMCNQNLDCYEGGPGGKFSAHDKNNLTQALCASPTVNVHGIQIEIVEDLRFTEKLSEATGKRLASAVQDCIDYCAGKSIKSYKPLHKAKQI